MQGIWHCFAFFEGWRKPKPPCQMLLEAIRGFLGAAPRGLDVAAWLVHAKETELTEVVKKGMPRIADQLIEELFQRQSSQASQPEPQHYNIWDGEASGWASASGSEHVWVHTRSNGWQEWRSSDGWHEWRSSCAWRAWDGSVRRGWGSRCEWHDWWGSDCGRAWREWQA